ncbi:hypothetical protein BJ165DRAFT_1608155 [Panaeolus papilionaceus]|nr:hypothetical protein BJ165DRAFT_1608155 [Panaeolus papilionaceus]
MNRGQPVRQLSDAELDNILLPVADQPDIDKFLTGARSGHRKSTKKQLWTAIPSSPGHENELYQPLKNLFNKILSKFDLHDKLRRRVLVTSDTTFHHLEHHPVDQQGLKSKPDLCAISLSDYFPRKGVSINRPEYNICASPIEVKRDKNKEGDIKHREQCAVYARQCLLQQRGRRFVFVPLFTETRAKLLRFDRGGFVESNWINYHNNPATLVRIVLLISGADPIRLGVNPHITWTSELPNPLITLNNVAYQVKDVISSSKGIRGRGTCVWEVHDTDGNPFTIKYQWRALDRTPEWELLEELKGLPGVVNMVSYMVDTKLSVLRGFGPSADGDREAAFIVMDAYGGPLTKSLSPEAFLFAFRDAIAGHQRIWDKDIIHRDISINNILLGLEGAPEGWRGVVIDLDLAIKADRKESLCRVDWLTGTRMFQSYLVLRSEELVHQNRHDEIPAHDHLDDLESFFYVFLWVTMGHRLKQDRTLIEFNPRPNNLTLFNQAAKQASSHKNDILRDPSDVKLDPSWPTQFSTLKDRLGNFLDYHAQKKKKATPQPASLSKTVAEAHYAIILGYIDQTIQELNDGKVAPPKALEIDFKEEESNALETLRAKNCGPISSGAVESDSASATTVPPTSTPSPALLPPTPASPLPVVPTISAQASSSITASATRGSLPVIGSLPAVEPLPALASPVMDRTRKRDDGDVVVNPDDAANGDVSVPYTKKMKTPSGSASASLS